MASERKLQSIEDVKLLIENAGLNPEDVFEDSELETWAEDNGYTKG